MLDVAASQVPVQPVRSRIPSVRAAPSYEVSGAHAVAGDETTARAGAAWG